MNLIHVTSMKHLNQIKISGLMPMTHTPKSGNRLYAVERSKLAWACVHIMQRHNVKPHELLIISIPMPCLSKWRKYNRGIWYTRTRVRVYTYRSLKEYVAKFPGLTLHNQEIWDRLL
jgi:hypothetical protein